jgi:LmbE family N-acetylglucosaminyl deacetylase
MENKRILIIAPHIDDEVLGCFSSIGSDTFVLYCGFDESHIEFEWVRSRPGSSERLDELYALVEKFGFSYKLLHHRVNHYHIQDLIPDFEKVINEVKPDEIYLPVPSYNQDHRVVYEAALTALRPHDMNHFVKRVFAYEQIQDLWNHNYHDFKPTYFKEVDMEKKIEAYETLKSQVRSFRSPKMLRDLASVRGIQANLEFAEAFEILRWVQ